MAKKKTDLTIEYMPVAELVKWDRNPKKHSLDGIERSIRERGYIDPIIIDERSGKMVSGHGRARCLLKMQEENQLVPDRVKVDSTGAWLVPVLRGVSFATDSEAEAYIIAANRLVEAGGWDNALLAELLSDLREAGHLDSTGYSESEADALLAELQKSTAAEGDDEEEKVPEEVEAKPGELWLLGGHRLLCGNSTSSTDVARLLDGKRPLMLVSDPPYGVEYDPSWRDAEGLLPLQKGKSRRTGKVENDDQFDWTEAWKLFTGDVSYIWHDYMRIGEMQLQLRNVGMDTRSLIIWKKPRFAISRGHYHSQHEAAWYAVRKGKKSHWCGDHSQSTVWEIPMVNKSDEDATNHGTQKPVECMLRPIRNHGRPGNIVYDPFVGSGTTIIAAERGERLCYAMELNPEYVQMAINRWERITGGKAVRG